jgi:putative hemolysin
MKFAKAHPQKFGDAKFLIYDQSKLMFSICELPEGVYPKAWAFFSAQCFRRIQSDHECEDY